MIKTNWIVFTGGPSSGKTTIIEFLKSEGYKTLNETARTFIEQKLSSGKSLQEIKANESVFQKQIQELQIKKEANLNTNQLVFLDRGVPDSIAYLQMAGANTDDAIELSKKRKYKKAFLMEQLPFKNDHIRSENEEKAQILSTAIYKVYSDLGYNITRVPIMSINKRLDFIKESINLV